MLKAINDLLYIDIFLNKTKPLQLIYNYYRQFYVILCTMPWKFKDTAIYKNP